MKGKIIRCFIWMIQIIMAIILFHASISKFEAAPDVVQMFAEIHMEPHGRILIGVLELLVVFLLLIPQSSVYGAFLGLGIMTGAMIGHFTDIGIEGLEMAITVFLGCLIILYARRHESSIFRNMFNR